MRSRNPINVRLQRYIVNRFYKEEKAQNRIKR